MGKFVDLSGERIGSLIVIGRHPTNSKSNKVRWDCLCDCGSSTTVLACSLVRKDRPTLSCGCRMHGKLPYQSAFNQLFSNYKVGARTRDLVFELTKEDCFILFKDVCHYCGRSPMNNLLLPSGSVMLYNGIDRVDNSQGYTSDNVVTCCSACNKSKHTRDKVDFIEHCIAVADYQRSTSDRTYKHSTEGS